MRQDTQPSKRDDEDDCSSEYTWETEESEEELDSQEEEIGPEPSAAQSTRNSVRQNSIYLNELQSKFL